MHVAPGAEVSALVSTCFLQERGRVGVVQAGCSGCDGCGLTLHFASFPNGSAPLTATPPIHAQVSPVSLLTQACPKYLTWSGRHPEEDILCGKHSCGVCGQCCLTFCCPPGLGSTLQSNANSEGRFWRPEDRKKARRPRSSSFCIHWTTQCWSASGECPGQRPL